MTSHTVSINSNWDNNVYGPAPNWAVDQPTWIVDDRIYVGHRDGFRDRMIGPGTGPSVDEDFFKKIMGQPTMSNHGWREKIDADDESVKVLATDIPGVHANTMNVKVCDGKLVVVGQRFDTNETVERTFDLGDKYDPSTASASLTHGILTVRVKMHEKFADRVIEVESPDE